MAITKSLDEVNLVAALLHDVHRTYGAMFNRNALCNTTNVVKRRVSSEGLCFLTKTLPRLGKAFDKALAGDTPLNSADHRLASMKDSKLPIFMGEFFSRVLSQDGEVLHEPCVNSVQVIRQICYLFYKYELPYTDEQEQQVIQKFERTEDDLETSDKKLRFIYALVQATSPTSRMHKHPDVVDVVRKARRLLSNLFAFFDPKDVYPRHGPGVVATKQTPWDKYVWTNISAKIAKVYPIDEYFYTSVGHVCDRLDAFSALSDADLPARVLLVPKDSRGPRLISCEPVDYQWIQQGLHRALVELIEHNVLTKYNVFFTDQSTNQRGALLGSINGKYSTLDLNEASDRVSTELVRLLFPPHIYEYLECCRSSSTVLPGGKVLELRKFAPMGSALCFPILALTIWSILTAAAPDTDTRESIIVYGDDVIVPTAFADDAIKQLETFGLKVNREKSCIRGSFRESCGCDAFKGIEVTPIRIRTVWSSSCSPESYTSWIAYANSFYDKTYFSTYDYIVAELVRLYGPIPSDEMSNYRYPSLRELPQQGPIPTRSNPRLQKREFRVWTVRSPAEYHSIPGWAMLLRYFAERGNTLNKHTRLKRVVEDSHSVLASPVDAGALVNTIDNSFGLPNDQSQVETDSVFRVSSYTRRNTSMLVRRWR